MKRTASGILAVAGLLSLSAACASLSRPEEARPAALVADPTGSTARGTIVLAAVGGVSGEVIGRQMDQQALELTYELPGATVERIGEGIQVTFPEGLLFEYDSDDLSHGAQLHLRSFAVSLSKYPRTKSMIVGHTDSKGTGDYNTGLSQRRAESALTYLVEQGVSRTRLASSARGSTEPVATNDTDRGRQQNRRVEIAVYADEAFRRQAKAGN
jgi:outer membrane protein OmpA-like peptidoglycan-associated protein